jgi:haloacid dehalogenase superfamily, subfamily IA, variant 3 with third motif having DD or ED/haloacid dehalogenase superfamily, subfamily IA, variant 1 with third motif having Dx(3-4)D or Dx(3-4)E
MKRYKAVIFDWDGTVMDSTSSIVAAIQAACVDMELPVPTVQDASWVIGLSLQSALQRCAPTLTDDRVPAFIERYRHHYFGFDKQLRMFDGILPLIEDLRQKNVRLGVATGKSRIGLDRVLKAQQLTSHFDCTRCADEAKGKPHPAMLYDIMKTLDLRPEQVIMVGDTTHDVQMATNAGVDSMAVTYGAHSRRTLLTSEPTVMVSSVAEMKGWLTERVYS